MKKSPETTKSAPGLMREKAYRHLQRKVLSGELPAGSVLSEVSLARELGLSRTPLREAIGQLVAEGFLQQVPKRGTAVLDFALRDLSELYELREALEVYAVRKASQQSLRPSDLDLMVGSINEITTLMKELDESGQVRLNAAQMQLFVKADLGFHTLLLASASNSRIIKVVGDTRVLLNIFSLHRSGHDASQLADIRRFHHEILESVVRKDGETAARLVGEHIRLSRLERLKEYEAWEREKAMRRILLGLGSQPQLELNT